MSVKWRKKPQTCRAVVRIAAAAAVAKLLQSCLTLCDPIDGSLPGSPSLGFSRQEQWVGCHFLLQWMKVKIESEVTQSCPTLSDPMDCNLPGSSVHGIFQADDPVDAGNLISGSSTFSKTSLNIWVFTVHILLKPGLENFEHYFASMWDECNCVVV